MTQFTDVNYPPHISVGSELHSPPCIESLDSHLSLTEFALAERDSIDRILLISGSILLRGFKIGTEQHLENFVREFSGGDLFNYAGGASPRKALSSRGLYTSTDYPQEIRIPLHNELSYSRIFPRHLFFWCVTPAESGGATTIADSRRILRAIPIEIVHRFKDKGICYIRNLHSGRGSGYSWQDAFETDLPAEAVARCHEMGGQCEWLDDGYLRVTQVCPATVLHPVTGEEVWFNQADGFHSTFTEGLPRLESRYGDGAEISISDLRAIRKAVDNETIPHKWLKDDVMIVDNILSAHGRMPYTGKRKIVLAMT